MSSCRVSKLRCPGTCRQRANAILYQSGSLMGSVHVNWYAVRRSCAASLLAEAVSKVSDLESDRSPWLWMIVTIREWNVRPLDSLDFKFLQIPWDFGFAANIAPRPPPLPSLSRVHEVVFQQVDHPLDLEDSRRLEHTLSLGSRSGTLTYHISYAHMSIEISLSLSIGYIYI